MTLYVLFNGPPRSGKNTFAEMVKSDIPWHVDAAIIGFSHHLKRFVHGIYLGRDGWDLDPDHFDSVKSEPQSILSGFSWRQAYIHYSEKVIKPLHGDGWFGDQLVDAAKRSGADVILVPDSGFRTEAERVITAAGAENILLIKTIREDHDFTGDSRGWVSLKDLGVEEHDILNTDLKDLRSRTSLVTDWLKERGVG